MSEDVPEANPISTGAPRIPRARRGPARSRPLGIVLGWTFCALLASGAGAEEPEPRAIRIEARVQVPLSGVRPTSIAIDPEGRVTVHADAGSAGTRAVDLEFRLTPEEARDLREALEASRFFDEWTRGTAATDLPTWDVTIRRGSVAKSRRIYGQPEFEPLERWLWRLVVQAETTQRIRGGDAYWARSNIPRVFRPAALAPELVRCAIEAKDAARCAQAAAVLVELLAVAEWQAAAEELLASLDAERRASVLLAWWEETKAPGREEYRRALVDRVVLELESAGVAWESDRHRALSDHLLEHALEARRPEAFALAELRVRTLGTLEKAHVPPGLLATGDAAVPTLLRLLADERDGARYSAVHLAFVLVHFVTGRTYYRVEVPEAERPALKERLAREVIPLLERMARDERESFALRSECFRALERWRGAGTGGEEQAALRATPPPPSPPPARPPATPPQGDLAIDGRVLGPEYRPLRDFAVLAFDAGGAAVASARTGEDGTFRIAGLPQGRFLLAAVPPPGRASPRTLQANGSKQDGVPAGTSGVVLRFPGGMIRGRLIDADGRPAPRRVVLAQMRDAPNYLTEPFLSPNGYAETDEEGRFWMMQLLPGLYDVTLPGTSRLVGGEAVEPGVDEVTFRIDPGSAITGRTVDERGDPLPGADVEVLPWGGGFRDRSGPDGSFRIAGLDVAERYEVAASYSESPPLRRTASAKDVAGGASDVVLAIDTAPHLRLRVDFRSRMGGANGPVRLVRVGEGSPAERLFHEREIHWRAAPEGTWKVMAQVPEVDAEGRRVRVWLEVGTIATGDPERTFVVPP